MFCTFYNDNTHFLKQNCNKKWSQKHLAVGLVLFNRPFYNFVPERKFTSEGKLIAEQKKG